MDSPPAPPPARLDAALAAVVLGALALGGLQVALLRRVGLLGPAPLLEAAGALLALTALALLLIDLLRRRAPRGLALVPWLVLLAVLADALLVVAAAEAARYPRASDLNLAIAELLLPTALALAAAHAPLLLLLGAASALGWRAARRLATRRLAAHPRLPGAIGALGLGLVAVGGPGLVLAVRTPAASRYTLAPLAAVAIDALPRLGPPLATEPLVPLEGAPAWRAPRPTGPRADLAGPLAASAAARATGGLDVVIVVCESLTAVDCSPWGGPARMPNLERWLQRGVRFDRAYAHDNHSFQGLVSLLLGRHPPPHEVVLRRLTGWTGPALGRTFTGAGRSTFLLWGGNPDGEGSRDLAREADDFGALRFVPEVHPELRAAHDGHLIRAFDLQLAEVPPDQPFLGVLWTVETHSPYTWWTYQGVPAPEGAPTDERGQYRASIEKLDEHLGELEAVLRARGRWERTIVAVVSDHGEGFGVGSPANTNHGCAFFEVNSHIPFAVTCPSVFDGPRVERRLVQLEDVAATLAHLALGGPLELGDGVSAFAELDAEPAAYFTNYISWGIVRDRWKLQGPLLGGQQTPRLVDLRADPTEATDVAALHPEVRDALYEEFRGWYARFVAAW